MIASVAGIVERVNKLVTVRALRTRYAIVSPIVGYADLLDVLCPVIRYNPEIGDLVIGRITEASCPFITP